MGPAGCQALLYELHTHRFNVRQAQYLEVLFERTRHADSAADNAVESYFPLSRTQPFGDFWDVEGYAGFVPSEKYLASMLNRAIEADEADANQHTSCLAPDQLAIDDSHKASTFQPLH